VRQPLYVAFWTRFLERLAVERPGWSNATKPQPTNWMQMPCPLKGLSFYSPSFAQGGKLRSELYLDFADPDQVTEVFDKLAEQKDLIESTYGDALTWAALPGKRAARIGDYAPGSVTNGDDFDAYIDWFFDSGDRLRAAIDAALARLQS